MTRKLIRRLVILLAILLVVSLLVMLAAAAFLPKETVRDRIIAEVAGATGAEVSLGSASVRLFPRLGITLDEGRIVGTGAALQQQTGADNILEFYEIQLKRLDVTVALKPLLKKQIRIETIQLSGPVIAVAWQGGDLRAEDYSLQISELSLGVDAARASADAGAGGSDRDSPPGEMIPQDLDLDFLARVEVLHFQGAPYLEASLQGDLSERVVTVESFSAGRGTGLMTGDLELDYDRDPWGKLTFNAQAADVPAGLLLEPWVPDLAARLDGALSADVTGGCDLRDPDTTLRTLDLTGSLVSGEGVLRARDWLRDVAPYLGDRQDLQDIRFRDLTHAFRIERGRYLVQDLRIVGVDTDWTGTGWVGLNDTIDLALQVKLPAGFTPDLGQWSFLADTLRDEEGRVQLDMQLTGRAAKPRVGVDLTRLQENAASGATESIRKGLGGLLDKWKTK